MCDAKYKTKSENTNISNILYGFYSLNKNKFHPRNRLTENIFIALRVTNIFFFIIFKKMRCNIFLGIIIYILST